MGSSLQAHDDVTMSDVLVAVIARAFAVDGKCESATTGSRLNCGV